ncbi:Z1 domain-containing protein [Herbiconiux sp. CPCC 205716]|uniref:Z1 domain-containing protein n=1 Tax=Herbiconiux gentiana TaxID=2970912 RepID=A0ABT2GBN3_9MICO|nr:Z1 domain-containing protein [Herbiconiux gentiana]MCS5713526.1 Z1 domain-containing protein [Herbiconiux gentiana]
MTSVVEAEKKKLLDLLNGLILNEEAITFEDLEANARGLAAILAKSLTKADVDDVVGRITEMRRVVLDIGDGVVDNRTFEPWLAERKPNAELPRWDAYRQLLVNREWGPNVISKLDAQTDKIVELMGDPLKGGEWSRRGLAIGEVQSGKTATYVGILNKAIDYGYKIIVVIGGHTEDLRRQTQRRIDTDLTGIDSSYILENVSETSHRTRVGVGKNTSFGTHVRTTTRTDFGAASQRAGVVAIAGESTPNVFVIKKNAKVLSNLTTYLTSQGKNGRLSDPLVVIDDEADWASVNTKSEDNVAAVNKAIRRLLGSSRRNSYLGITATPFANILIDDELEEDLFPRDYIQALESPSNYHGIERFFGETANSGGPIRTEVNDCLAVLPFNHRRTARLDELPESLLDAMATFFVGTAIRRIRGGEAKPASMMVNISRFNDVQEQVADLVADAVDEFRRAILSEFGLSGSTTGESPEATRLREAFEREYSTEVAWQSVRTELLTSAPEVRVELVNSRTMSARNKRMNELSRDERTKEDLQPKIFVGGDVLARGLTLDGLQVSYFVRRAGAADTLLQMGRWFGYRPGYGDLVRVWMDPDVVDLFKYVAEVSEDLRSSLKQMNALDMTPSQFGLKMQRHPEAFMITAANKRQHGVEVQGDVNIHGARFESHSLSIKPSDRKRNLDAARALADEVTAIGAAADDRENKNVWVGVPADLVHRFFMGFRGHDSDIYFGAGTTGRHAQLAAYLSDAQNSDEWDVGFVSGSSDVVTLSRSLEFKSSVRNRMEPRAPTQVALGNRRVAAGNDLKNSLPRDLVTELEVGLKEGEKLAETALIRNLVVRPLLLVFALVTTPDSRKPPTLAIGSDDPLIAVLVAFPALPLDVEATIMQTKPTRFVANKVFVRANLGLPVTEEDNEDEDDQ